MAQQMVREMGEPVECHPNDVHIHNENNHRVPSVLENIKEDWQTTSAFTMEKAMVLPDDIHGVPGK